MSCLNTELLEEVHVPVEDDGGYRGAGLVLAIDYRAEVMVVRYIDRGRVHKSLVACAVRQLALIGASQRHVAEKSEVSELGPEQRFDGLHDLKVLMVNNDKTHGGKDDK